MASAPEHSGRATEYYEKAASILETIKDSVEGDYVLALERLKKVYSALGRDHELNRTLNLLNAIQVE